MLLAGITLFNLKHMRTREIGFLMDGGEEIKYLFNFFGRKC